MYQSRVMYRHHNSETWKHTSIFYTYIQYGDKVYKLIINDDSFMNVVSKYAISRLKLKHQPLPYLYRVVWIDRTLLPISEYYLVPIHMGVYLVEIVYDMLSMKVASILLDRP